MENNNAQPTDVNNSGAGTPPAAPATPPAPEVRPAENKPDYNPLNNAQPKPVETENLSEEIKNDVNKIVESNQETTRVEMERNFALNEWFQTETGKAAKELGLEARVKNAVKMAPNLTVEGAIYAALGPDALKIGAKIAEKEIEKNNKENLGGSDARNTGPDIKDPNTMTPAEWEAYTHKIRSGGFKKDQ